MRSNATEKVDKGWGEIISIIEIEAELTEGLRGLDSFSHIMVVYHLHEAKFEKEQHLVRRPQGREDMPEVGIFAQRAKDRPNSIGITTVKLLEVTGNQITVTGLDAINGTPILDIKPYYPIYDCKNDAQVPDWVTTLMQKYF